MADEILAARVRDLFEYIPETGEFIRKVRLAQRHRVGSRADFVVTGGGLVGYRRVSFDSKRFLAHRVAWLYVHGEWPSAFIDHINGDRGDNRLANLRIATPAENVENQRKARKDNAIGLLGVCLHDDGVRWRARIQIDRKSVHIGLYSTPEHAHAAYLSAKRMLHKGCTI